MVPDEFEGGLDGWRAWKEDMIGLFEKKKSRNEGNAGGGGTGSMRSRIRMEECQEEEIRKRGGGRR